MDKSTDRHTQLQQQQYGAHDIDEYKSSYIKKLRREKQYQEDAIALLKSVNLNQKQEISNLLRARQDLHLDNIRKADKLDELDARSDDDS